MSDPLGLELHVVVTRPRWLLGTKLFLWQSRACFDCWGISPAFSNSGVLAWQCVLPHIGTEVLGVQPRVSWMVGQNFTNWANFSPLFACEMLILMFDGAGEKISLWTLWPSRSMTGKTRTYKAALVLCRNPDETWWKVCSLNLTSAIPVWTCCLLVLWSCRPHL